MNNADKVLLGKRKRYQEMYQELNNDSPNYINAIEAYNRTEKSAKAAGYDGNVDSPVGKLIMERFNDVMESLNNADEKKIKAMQALGKNIRELERIKKWRNKK